MQRAIIIIVRPYIHRELPGWGFIYRAFVGGYKRNWFWAGIKPFWMLEKSHKYLLHVDISHWSDRATFFLGRWYDLPTQLALKKILKPGHAVVDIGANYGLMSLVSSSLVGNAGKIIAFEPNTEPRKRFKKNIFKNNISNIVVYNFALGSNENTLELFVPYINSGEGTFGTPGYSSQEGYKVQCEVKIGDKILQDLTFALIKIDVEGFEEAVLRGLEKTIERCNPIFIVEMIRRHLTRCGSSIDNIFRFFESRDYRGYLLSTRRVYLGRQLELIDIVDSSRCPDGDILWIHKDDEQRKHLDI